MLDADLASSYQVDIKVLNQAVKRNRARFPSDFMFQLDALEKKYDSQFKTVFQVIRELIAPPASATRRIGFREADGC
jgi:hypothetical protein